MTVSMIISDTRDENYYFNVLISSTRIYDKYWLPMSKKLGLKTIELYAGALVAEQGNTNEIMEDLRKLRHHIEHYPEEFEGDDDYTGYMISRIDGLIVHLEQIEVNPNLKGFFG